MLRAAVRPLLGFCLLTALLLIPSAAEPPAAKAADCTVPTHTLLAGDALAISGGSCKDLGEGLTIYCAGGTVRIDYLVTTPPPPILDTKDTGVPCGTPTRLVVSGNGGDDTVDLTRVAKGTGFTGINLPNTISGDAGDDQMLGSPLADSVTGGAGADGLFLRDGVADTGDCGTEADVAVADALDTLTGCESVDAPPVAAPVVAAKKCKRKKRLASAAKKKRCKKKKK